MGQLIDEEECQVCEVFDQEWIFTYGDLVTLLLCFFILLFSMCKIDVRKIYEVSISFQPMPPGSPFLFKGKPSVFEKVTREVEQLDIPDDIELNTSDKGVEVSFRERILFEASSADLTPESKQILEGITAILSSMSNHILIEGHTDNEFDEYSGYPSNWEFSMARAASVATFLEEMGLPKERLHVTGHAHYRPRFHNDTSYKRSLNRRVEITLLPEEQGH